MQEPILFNVSIKDNILYGYPEATNKQVRDAAKLANAIEFIENENNIENNNSIMFSKLNQ